MHDKPCCCEFLADVERIRFNAHAEAGEILQFIARQGWCENARARRDRSKGAQDGLLPTRPGGEVDENVLRVGAALSRHGLQDWTMRRSLAQGGIRIE